MAALTTSSISALGGKLVVDVAMAANTASTNTTSATSGRIYLAQIDNPNSTNFYLKIRDHADATPSTTTANGAGTPHMLLKCPPYQTITYSIPGGFAYTAGVSIWGSTSTSLGSTTASPSNSVTVKLVCS